jgi:hypothetical protein
MVERGEAVRSVQKPPPAPSGDAAEVPVAPPPGRRLHPLIWAGAGFLILVVVAVVAINGQKPPVEDTPPPPAAVPGVESCVSVEHLSPKVIPHYLLNSIGSRNFPYLLKIIATNKCKATKIMTVRYVPGRNVVLEPPLTEPLTLPAGGKPVPKILAPNFDLARSNVADMSIQWSIEDEDMKKVGAGTITVDILRPYTIAWDLERPKEGGGWEPVDEGYLLASLKAWMLKPPRAVTQLGEFCRAPETGGPQLVKEEAIASCYERLFSGENAVPVAAQPITFPAGKRQLIRPHLEIIERRLTVSSLEAALLLAAVLEANHLHGVDYDLTLLVAPVEGTANPDREKTAFLAWREAGDPWRGVDMSRASTAEFAANVAGASGRAGTLLDLASEVRAAIAKRGAGFSADKRIAAVDFGAIPPSDGIRRLGIVVGE